MPYGDILFQRLRLAERIDLMDLLGDLRQDPLRFESATHDDLVNAISAEFRSAAGNSFWNMRREAHEFPYKQILIDVADKLAEGFLWTKFKSSGPDTEEEIEDYIERRVQCLLDRHLKSMGASDRAKVQVRLEADLRVRGLPLTLAKGALSVASAGTIAGILGGPLVAAALYGSLWTSLLGMSVRQLALAGVAGGGPVGIAIAAATVLSGTSYSKTVPAVTRLIQIRRSHEARLKLKAGTCHP